MFSGIGHNSLKIIKDVRGGVWGALECDNEAAALKMAALHQALRDLRGPQYAIAPPLVYYGNHEGHVHIPQHLAIGHAPQQHAIGDQASSSSGAVVPYGLNAVQLPKTRGRLPQTLAHPNPNHPAARSKAAEAAEYQRLMENPRTAEELLERALHGQKVQRERTTRQKKAARAITPPSSSTESGGRIGVPSPVLPYNDISNDHFLNKYPV